MLTSRIFSHVQRAWEKVRIGNPPQIMTLFERGLDPRETLLNRKTLAVAVLQDEYNSNRVIWGAESEGLCKIE